MICGWRILRSSEISRRTFSFMSRLRILLRFRILIATLCPVISCSATAVRASRSRRVHAEAVQQHARHRAFTPVSQQSHINGVDMRDQRGKTAARFSPLRRCAPRERSRPRLCTAETRTFDFAEGADAERFPETVVAKLDGDITHGAGRPREMLLFCVPFRRAQYCQAGLIVPGGNAVAEPVSVPVFKQ